MQQHAVKGMADLFLRQLGIFINWSQDAVERGLESPAPRTRVALLLQRVQVKAV